MTDVVAIVLLGGSLAAAVALAITRRGAAEPLLSYEPRRPVPWNGVSGMFLAMFLLLVSLTNFFASAPLPAQTTDSGMTAEQYIEASRSNAVACLLMVAVVSMAISVSTGATPRDFGLPTDTTTMVRDIRLGATAMAVGYGPVLLVQMSMIPLFKSGSKNQTLLALEDSKTTGVFLAAFLGAAIVAPIFEEFVCRLLLQGWLEKIEDRLFNPPGEGEDEESPSLRDRAASIGLVPGLVPILISSLVFALLHLTAGPDPIALFLFAVIQGYLYQRTHRILPCIVNHALLNAVVLTLTFWSA